MKRLCPTCGHRSVKCRWCAAADPEPEAVELDGPIVFVPQPPEWLGTPKRSIAVVTLAVGKEAKACLAVTRPFFERYAALKDADFVALDESFFVGHPQWPMSCKFGVSRVAQKYERIAYFDADVLLRPGHLCAFEAAGTADWAAVDEKPWHKEFSAGRYAAFLREHSLEHERWPFYFNAGVQVYGPKAAPWLLPPPFPVRADHCSEQSWVNWSVQRSGLKLLCLDRRCNWQNWTDWGFSTAPPDAALHWSGGGAGRKSRAEHMKEVADGCSQSVRA